MMVAVVVVVVVGGGDGRHQVCDVSRPSCGGGCLHRVEIKNYCVRVASLS